MQHIIHGLTGKPQVYPPPSGARWYHCTTLCCLDRGARTPRMSQEVFVLGRCIRERSQAARPRLNFVNPSHFYQSALAIKAAIKHGLSLLVGLIAAWNSPIARVTPTMESANKLGCQILALRSARTSCRGHAISEPYESKFGSL